MGVPTPCIILMPSNCKIKDCTELSVQERGRYARLCATHREEAELSLPRKHKQNGSKLKDTAIRLVEISERIDRSAAQFQHSRNQLIVDMDEFLKLLDDLKRDVRYIVTQHAN